jgi:hypothetical protein
MGYALRLRKMGLEQDEEKEGRESGEVVVVAGVGKEHHLRLTLRRRV